MPIAVLSNFLIGFNSTSLENKPPCLDQIKAWCLYQVRRLKATIYGLVHKLTVLSFSQISLELYFIWQWLYHALFPSNTRKTNKNLFLNYFPWGIGTIGQKKKKAQCEICELSFIWGRMGTQPEIASRYLWETSPKGKRRSVYMWFSWRGTYEIILHLGRRLLVGTWMLPLIMYLFI